jgi:hypothetical protein
MAETGRYNPSLRVAATRLPVHEYEALEAYARRTDRTISNVIRLAVRRLLKEEGGRK